MRLIVSRDVYYCENYGLKQNVQIDLQMLPDPTEHQIEKVNNKNCVSDGEYQFPEEGPIEAEGVARGPGRAKIIRTGETWQTQKGV